MIKVLHKAFDLLEVVSADKKRVFTLNELASEINEKPSTCANIVRTLCDRGYLCRVEPRGYAIGPVARELNFTDLTEVRLKECAREPMREFLRGYGASGVLAVLRRGKKRILDDYKSDGEVVVSKAVRKSYELYTTSSGLVLTCREDVRFSEEDAERIRATFGSVEGLEALRRSIAESGCVAISLRPGVFETAAAIVKEGRILGAVAVYLPEFLLDTESQKNLTQALCEVANTISERM